jgi:hypothetical protein
MGIELKNEIQNLAGKFRAPRPGKFQPLSGRLYRGRHLDRTRYPQMRDAEGNESHRALARLYQAGRLQAVITQNLVP